MKRLLIGVFAVSLFGLLSGLPAWAAPKMELSADVWDAGAIDQGKSQTTTLQVKNAGDATLVISQIREGCAACTKAELDKKTLEPGESADLRITFNATSMRGKVTKTVKIISNDPEKPEKVLTILADVKEVPTPRMELSTRDIDVGILAVGAVKQARFEVKNTGPAELTIRSFRNSPHLKADVAGASTVAPGEARQIVLSVGPLEKEGVVSEYCYVQSNDPKSLGALVQVKGYVTDEVAARGLRIVPVGEPVAVEGTEQKSYQEYELKNMLPVAVSIGVEEMPGATLTLAKNRLEPGESTSLKLQAADAAAALNTSLKITIEWPASFKP